MKIGELIERLGGTLAQGDAGTAITGVNGRDRVTATELLFAEDAASAADALTSRGRSRGFESWSARRATRRIRALR